MLCCISGKVPLEPVVSRVNGCLYERRLVDKYIDEHGRCPKTGDVMRKEDLIIVTGGSGGVGLGASVQAPDAASIPAMLQLLHNEWDALMLEQFSLRQQLAQCQQELSHALYQHDAACRVIAKLMKEKDELKGQLRQHTGRGGDTVAADDDDDEEDDAPVLPEHIASEIDENAKRLKTRRENQQAPRSLATAAQLSTLHETASAALHSDRTTNVAVHCIAVNEAFGNKLVFSGGADGKAVCYDVARGVAASTLIGHTKAIRKIFSSDDTVITCSDDSTTRFWKNDGGSYRSAAVLRGHQGCVTGFAPLPSQKHIVTCGTDGALLFSDLHTGVKVAAGRSPESSLGISCVELHPDGYFAVSGSANKVLIWDLKHMEVQHVLHDGEGTITDLSFNPLRPFQLAASTARGVVKLWDLRRPDAAPQPITFDDSSPTRPIAVNRISFDQHGQYLAVATNTVKVWDMKSNAQIVSVAAHMDPVTDVSWGADAQWLVSSSLDRTIRIYES